MSYLTDQPLGPVIFGAVDRISLRQDTDWIGEERVCSSSHCSLSWQITSYDARRSTEDYVVLRTMLLFSRVDVTLHAGGGTPGGCSVWADSGSTAIQRGDWL